MPRRLFSRLIAGFRPAIDAITTHPLVRRHVPALADPNLWHVNRRSAARAVAVGLFCGLIPGPLQAAGAIAGSLGLRANFPLAVATTFYTNPFTIVPLYVVAYEYGRLFFPGSPPAVAVALPWAAGATEWLAALLAWMAELGPPLAVGLVLLAVTLAATGWGAVRLAWRWHTVRAWRRRSRVRAAAARA